MIITLQWLSKFCEFNEFCVFLEFWVWNEFSEFIELGGHNESELSWLDCEDNKSDLEGDFTVAELKLLELNIKL